MDFAAHQNQVFIFHLQASKPPSSGEGSHIRRGKLVDTAEIGKMLGPGHQIQSAQVHVSIGSGCVRCTWLYGRSRAAARFLRRLSCSRATALSCSAQIAMESFVAQGIVHFKRGNTWYVGCHQLRVAYRQVGLSFVDDSVFMRERGATVVSERAEVLELVHLGVVSPMARTAAIIEVRVWAFRHIRLPSCYTPAVKRTLRALSCSRTRCWTTYCWYGESRYPPFPS